MTLRRTLLAFVAIGSMAGLAACGGGGGDTEAGALVETTVETAPDVSDAVALALGGEGPAPRVVICGGLHFAGEVLALSPETWPA